MRPALSRTKAHLIGKWELKLEFARPYTPDDNAWIETFIKYMKYHPACPDKFETAQDVIDWVAKFQKLYNDHPHSALRYVRPNDEHEGLGNTIRTQRKENLLVARKVRLGYYHSQKAGVSNYGTGEDRGPESSVGEDFGMAAMQNRQEIKNGVLEVLRGRFLKQLLRPFVSKSLIDSEGWIKPWRDYRKYPVFTVFDIEKIIKWRNTIKLSKEPNVRRDVDDFL